MKNAKYRILVAYHKPDILFEDDILQPIQVGRDIMQAKTDEKSQQTFRWMYDHMIGDNTGDNISNKNGSYNEMTALYWAWKNYDELGNPDYVGLMHYRRHFCLKQRKAGTAYLECNQITDPQEYIKNTLGLTAKGLDEIFGNATALVSTPYYKESVYEHYKTAHDIKQLDFAIDLIKRKYKKYAKACTTYLNGHNTYFCNMFVFPREVFFEYCDFVFGVLDDYISSDVYDGGRLFLSERLTGIFIQYLIDSKKKVVTAPTMYLEETTVIPVAFATDANFVPPTTVAIRSMLANARPSTSFKIYIMTPSENVQYVKDEMAFLSKEYSNYELEVLDMGRQFSDVKMSIKHITAQTYYRLQLPSLLKDCDKCLYLDSDIVITGDLAELYRNNISDHYVGGVRAAGYYHPEAWVQKHTAELGLPSIDLYINAGVLLLNLKKIREDKLDQTMLDLVSRGFSSQDQDIINLACYPKIKILPLRYNCMTKYLHYKDGQVVIDEEDRAVFGEANCLDALKSPILIHYADKIKPWQDSSVVFYEQWYEHASKVPFYSKRPSRKISVIIPIYNMEKYLGECLDSVFAQTLKDIEVICINDGSKDRSAEILSEYKKMHDNLYVINQTNHGVGYSRNVGIAFASSEYLCFMDPDDFYPANDVLEALYNAAKKYNVLVAGGSWQEFIEKEDGTSYYKKDFSKTVNSGYTFLSDGMVNYKDYQFDFGYHRFIYSTKMLHEKHIVFPYYSRFQDPPFFVRAMIAAGKFYALKKHTYCYRLGYQVATIFKGQKLVDYTLGVIDMLRISQRSGLAKLHKISLDRLTHTTQVYIDRITAGDNPYLLELLVRANTAVDRKLLATVMPEVNENYMIIPLRKVLGYFTAAAKEKRISAPKKPKKKNVFVRAIRYCKKNGLKCTIIRIFAGREVADKYKRKEA